MAEAVNSSDSSPIEEWGFNYVLSLHLDLSSFMDYANTAKNGTTEKLIAK